MKIHLLAFAALLASTGLFAQNNCRQQEYLLELKLHPVYKVNRPPTPFPKKSPFNNHPPIGAADSTSVYPVPALITIPVVVHILWNTAQQNISNAAVLSQLDVLNKDYNALNTDYNKIPAYFRSASASAGISFALAKTDPDGNPCNGIIRKQTSVLSFGFDDRAKMGANGGDDAWDARQYLNIWVCNLVDGVSGYASTPGCAIALDGVVISTSAFGTINVKPPFNLGRTATHEIGHWLNLRHLWGDANCGDDFVDDTPQQQGPNRGCNSGEKFTCGNTANGDMYMDFMDFSDDGCMYMFTNGQRKRMRALFEPGNPRNGILSSKALSGAGVAITDSLGLAGAMDVLLYPNPATDLLRIQMNVPNNAPASTLFVTNYLGQVMKIVRGGGRQLQVNISDLPPGIYFLRLESCNGKTSRKFVKQ